MKKHSQLAAALCLTLFACGAHAQPTRRVMIAADLLRVANVGDPQISPDGERVVYTVTTVDRNTNVTTPWIVRVDNSSDPPTSRQPEQRRDRNPPTFPASPLLPPGWQGTNPRWSPDGKRIAFLAPADNRYGIWVATIDGSRPRFVAGCSGDELLHNLRGRIFRLVARFEKHRLHLGISRSRPSSRITESGKPIR